MNSKELKQKIIEIDAQLKALGDLNLLVQQSQALPGIVTDIQSKKTEFETLLSDVPDQIDDLENSISEAQDLTKNVKIQEEQVSVLYAKVDELQTKVNQLIEETRIQLGVASNAKLASTFEQVKDDLKIDKKNMFWWLFGSIGFLVIATVVVVLWQIKDVGTLYHLSFPVRVALLSPVVYFVVFINREYNRARNLIEEYTFKASIARSFEAYREIVQGADADSTKTLDFILKSITDLYSSPMVNIKKHSIKEKENAPEFVSQIQEILKDGLVQKS
jgi:hypothetical protein